MEDLTGKRLSGQYILNERIGSGGMSDVYKAWDTARSIFMAVKVLHSDLSRHPQTLKMFESEAAFLKENGHPNIARMYEFKKDQGYYYLVLEWIDGESLDQILKKQKKPFSLDQVSNILLSIASALNYLHVNDVLHCDVKPGNILINLFDKAFLVDLGVARLSRSGSVGGTIPYMAPELISKGIASPQSDIYALGITVFELLSGGVLPFRGDSKYSKGSTSKEKIAWEHLNLPQPSIRNFNAELPSQIEIILKKALSKDPRHRFATAHDFHNAFEQACNGMGSTIIQPFREEKTKDKPRSQESNLRKKESDQLANIDKKHKRHQRLIGVQGEWQFQVILITGEQLTLGRHGRNSVCFSDRSISRFHALLYQTRQGVFIRDEGSSFGTIVNDQRIDGWVKLDHGDRIQLGYNNILEYRER
jgi:serine/threonine protein kinase